MKDLNHEDMSRAILFKIEVKDSYKEGGPRIHRTIEVITETLTMKVFIVMRNDKIDQVFFNVDPAIARTAAEARSCELTAKWAITRVVEQEVIEVGVGPVLADVSANLVYEWVRTGHWNLNKFTRWLGAKHIDPKPGASGRRSTCSHDRFRLRQSKYPDLRHSRLLRQRGGPR